MAHPPKAPADRYGSRRRAASGRWVVIGLGVLIALALAASAAVIFTRDEQTVRATMTNFERVDDDTMSLSIDIERDEPERDSYCIVTALDYSMAEVGRREVPVPAGGPGVISVDVELPTRDVPVSGGVYGCSTEIPEHLEVPPRAAADDAS
ncbi:DUF4307 domain-containing protein [Corynebacterium otitidis]|nr:hypothetical protein AAV33_06755 [Corynebacterium otitidis]